MDRARVTERARGRVRAVGIVSTLLLATLSAVLVPAPRPAAAADPLPSTVAVYRHDQYPGYSRLGIDVRADGVVIPTGAASVSLDGTELARLELAPYATGAYGWANVALPPGTHALTIEYLGSADVLPSSVVDVRTVAVPSTPQPMTGSLQVGATTVALADPSTFSRNTGTDFFNPVSGEVSAAGMSFGFLTVTGDVPNVGPVSLGVRPAYSPGYAYVAADGSVAVWPGMFYLFVQQVTVDGVPWSTECLLTHNGFGLFGAVDATGLSVSGSSDSALTPVAPSACGGRGDLVNALLSGPVGLDLRVEGSFPLPPTPNTPTTTTLAVTPASGVGVLDHVLLTATVTVPGYEPQGTVTFLNDGVYAGAAQVGAAGTAQLRVPMLTPGAHTITADYGGFSVTRLTTVTLLSPSSATAVVEVAPAPVGRAVTGFITVGTGDPAPLPAGAVQVGAPFDPATGEIGAGRLWFPVGEFLLASPVGPLPVQFRLVQVEESTGQVAPDGTVTFTPAQFRLEAWAYKYPATSPSWSSLRECTFEPIEVTLSGTADASGLHLSQDDIVVPPVPAAACAGFGGVVNAEADAGLDVGFEVEGDFSLTGAESSSTAVVSWFPTVAVRNQTFVSATVTAAAGTPSGVVEFVDDGVVVGSAVLNDAGVASAVVTLDRAGTRTITANFSGGGGVGPSSGSTTVEVTPEPDGYVLDGSVTVGGVELDVPEGSRLMPASSGEGWSVDGMAVLGGGFGAAVGAESAATTAAAAAAVRSSGGILWFNPTQVALVVPGLGAVTAEVRVLQVGEFGAALINPGGRIDGLSAMYVLHVRRVTTSEGSVTPLGCVNLLVFGFDAQMTLADVVVSSSAGGSGRIPWPTCTGAGRAVAEALVGESSAQMRAEF